MSGEQIGEAEQPEAQKKPTTEELLGQLLKAEEENRKNIDMLAKAIVEVNKKVEAKATNPSEGGGEDALKVIASILKPSGGTIEDFGKQAKAFAEAADALDRFRHPSRIGLGEALLMRAGLRATYPRYMTKAEIERAEKALGAWEALEGEEGETEHVSE